MGAQVPRLPSQGACPESSCGATWFSGRRSGSAGDRDPAEEPGCQARAPPPHPTPQQEEAPGRCVGSSLLRKKSAPPAPCHAPDRACPRHCPASSPLGQAPLGFLTCAEQRATFQGGAQMVCVPPLPLIRSASGKLVLLPDTRRCSGARRSPGVDAGNPRGEAPLPGGCPSTAPPGVGGADRLRAGGWSPGRGGGARPLPRAEPPLPARRR